MGTPWCIIFNPAAARKRAKHRLAELRARLGSAAVFRPTERPGHAEELACDAVSSGFTHVAAAGGDGTVHEVANGVLRAGRPETVFAVCPLGSANDYAYSLERTINATEDVVSVDAGLVREPGGRDRFFINSLGLGFSGAVALESRSIPRLQGLALYGLAFLRVLCLRFTCPTMTIHFDEKRYTTPTLSATIALGQREGSFVVAPEARLDDGLFDYLLVGPLSRFEVLRFMPKLASGGKLPTNHPALWQGCCRTVRIVSESALTVHVDGEFFCRPEDDIHEIDIRLLPAALRVQPRGIVNLSGT